MRPVVQHPFPHGLPDEWAIEWGQDKYGVFESFAIEGVVQRMRWIEPGRFWMGSPPAEAGRFDNEVRHEVVLSHGYWVADTPCTQALWRAVMGDNPSHFKGDDQRPVEQVRWGNCQNFLKRLRVLLSSGHPEQADGMSWRLPTEAEWERACRANTDGATWLGELESGEDGKSKVLERIGWYDRNSGGETHRVSEMPPNPFGLHDMLGNVYEWCEGWYGAYDSAFVVDPCGPEEGGDRVLRGGSWISLARYCRAASRYASDPRRALGLVGFRLARGRAPSPGAEPRGGAEGGRRAEPPSGGAGAGRSGAPRSSDRK